MKTEVIYVQRWGLLYDDDHYVQGAKWDWYVLEDGELEDTLTPPGNVKKIRLMVMEK